MIKPFIVTIHTNGLGPGDPNNVVAQGARSTTPHLAVTVLQPAHHWGRLLYCLGSYTDLDMFTERFMHATMECIIGNKSCLLVVIILRCCVRTFVYSLS